ncbi:oxidoreductase [Segnochrobactraceae bacterium EtOH-i3]
MVALNMESPTVSAIYASYVANDKPTDPVRLSLFHAVGACARAAWLGLRWAVPPERHDGQRMRNFARRRTEGAELASMLTAAGAEVSFLDMETLRPWEVDLAGGHARVKVDGIAIGLPEAPKKRHVVVARALDEAGFRRLRQEGVEKARPADAAAMQVAMSAFGAPRGAILAVNLGTDELLLERIEADPIRAARVGADVEWIVCSQQPPARIHEDPAAPAAFACRGCRFSGICHGKGWARRTCRTCLHATPETDGDGRWTCARFGRDLSAAEQASGCPSHLYVPGLVPGEQIDASAAGEWVDYRLADGTTWRDSANQ